MNSPYRNIFSDNEEISIKNRLKDEVDKRGPGGTGALDDDEEEENKDDVELLAPTLGNIRKLELKNAVNFSFKNLREELLELQLSAQPYKSL
jgi:hypothetical protein